MIILGIETSCDETSAAVVRDGREVLSNVVFSQTHLHAAFGGVVPEIASRAHLETLPGVIETAVSQAGVKWREIDAISVTYGPGLASSLLVGMSSAKALALRLNIPLILVNHVEAHVYSVFLGKEAPQPEDIVPFLALVVSGGHTCLIKVEFPGKYELLGQTTDDAAGEAFDKAANVLGLGYPGGPAIERASADGDPDYVQFPRGNYKQYNPRLKGLRPELCFSFSGVKTALIYYLKRHPVPPEKNESKKIIGSIAASYQEAIVDAIVEKAGKAIGNMRWMVAGGGVILNSRLRQKLMLLAKEKSFHLLMAEPAYCADNAAMVAGIAYKQKNVTGEKAFAIDAQPNLRVGENFD
jgi:N6-L-threonylcarbamoyladenine synthase